MSRMSKVVAALLSGVLAGVAFASPATAVQPAHPATVDAVPSSLTPAFKDGQVFAILEIGSTMVIGGTFTQASAAGSSEVVSRSRILAFDASTGAIDPNFAPVLDDYVETLLPGPTPGTVYAGGKFGTVNGVAQKGLVLLELATGQPVAGFRPGYLNGLVQDMALRDGRLLIAGTFTKIGSLSRGGLASLDPTTGVVTSYLTATVTEHHNYNGTGAFGAIGVTRFDITPDGTRMVLIGNFRKVDGQERRQIAMLNLSGSTAVLATDWKTSRFSTPCRTQSVDSWVRDVDISPDGSYFVVVGKGAYYADTLCDTASRWETRSTGTDVAPSWVAVTGGDTLLSVAVTGAAVYVGGHQRWLNNPLARDAAGPGAVPRPGIAALDPVNGVPLSWNPGRNPRGIGTAVLYATAAGLWTGSDTDYIGNFRYLRPKLAFFPLNNTTAPNYSPTSLPANVYFGGPISGTLGGGSTVGVDDLARRWFTGVGTPGAVIVESAGGIRWSQVRGAFMLGSTMFYGYADGTFHRRSFDGIAFGPDIPVDPYNDAEWSSALTGKSGGQTYRGTRPDFYGELSRVTGMFANRGRLYYSLSGDVNLYSRAFSADSGTVHPTRVTVPGGTLGDLSGLFFSGDVVYFVGAADGTLRSRPLLNGTLSGSVKVLSGPSVDGSDWRGRAVFLGPGAQGNPAETISFVGASSFTGTTKSGSVAVPAEVSSGDGMLLFVTVNSVTQPPSAPQGLDGWREVGRRSAGSMLTVLWQRVVGAGEAGTTVSVSLPDYAKLDLQVLVYRGTSAGGPVASASSLAELASAASHTTPSVAVAEGSWVISWWADKSSTTTTWTAPGGLRVRDVVIGTGSGYVSSLVADSGRSVPAGQYGAHVATVNTPSSKAVTWTIVLAGEPA